MTDKTQANSDLLSEIPVVISIGIVELAEALSMQGAEVVQVDWRPPASGDDDLISILDALS
jgi:hypothetical protein